MGSEFPLAQEVYWESKELLHELAFGHCRDFPGKSLAMLLFWKHKTKSFKDVSGLLLALAFPGQKREDEASVTWKNSGILQLCLIISGLCTCLGDFIPSTTS